MIVSGYASTHDLDLIRDMVAPGAFDASIKAQGLGGPKGVKLLWHHKDDKPLGRILKLEQRKRGLWIEADIDEAISWGRDVAAAVKANGGLSFSIGYRIEDADIGEGRDGLPYLILKRLHLLEVSVVVFPCNPEAVMGSWSPRHEPLAVDAAITELSSTLSELNSILREQAQ